MKKELGMVNYQLEHGGDPSSSIQDLQQKLDMEIVGQITIIVRCTFIDLSLIVGVI